ncbi:MAG TPA: DUF4832 domain-containing protein, partial [Candidatus Glassbacteria bacterium]|nr:DUF4832 domain-containing protein [Candidatus Glassbacteria bacterium]
FNIGSEQTSVEGRKISRREMIARDDPEDFKYRQALDVALERGYHLARHGFIDGLGYTDKRIMEEEWPRSSLMAEGDWSYLDVKNHLTHGTLKENIDIMLKWHSNYAHFYVDADSYRRLVREDADHFATGLRPGGLGYRLVLWEVCYPAALAPGHLLVVLQSWENLNVGRCYRRHPLRLYLTDGSGKEVFAETDYSFDQTSWVRGRQYELTSVFHLPQDLAEGEYGLRIALVDWEGNPALRLGIEGRDNQGRYLLGNIQIGSKA